MTQEGHRSSSAHSLKQLITDTLRSGMEYTNAAGLRQGAATTGQCSNNMNCIPEPDDQGVKIISGDSTYWQDWEKKFAIIVDGIMPGKPFPSIPTEPVIGFLANFSSQIRKTNAVPRSLSTMASMWSMIVMIP